MTILKVRHITHYAYSRPVSFGEHHILFRPRDSYDQRLLYSTITISPEPRDLHWVHDVFGNCVAVASFDGESADLRIETSIALDHAEQFPLQFRSEGSAADWPFDYDEDILPDLAPFRARGHAAGDALTLDWARRFAGTGKSTKTAHLLESMTQTIKSEFSYVRRSDEGTQTPMTTLETKSGSCRDFALLMIEACRALGFAARFVTGYIFVESRGGSDNLGGGSTHAWVQIFLPGTGWVEFDPTNGIIGNRDLIRVGVARDPSQVVPVSGTRSGKPSDFKNMTVQVNVTQEPSEVT